MNDFCVFDGSSSSLKERTQNDTKSTPLHKAQKIDVCQSSSQPCQTHKGRVKKTKTPSVLEEEDPSRMKKRF